MAGSEPVVGVEQVEDGSNSMGEGTMYPGVDREETQRADREETPEVQAAAMGMAVDPEGVVVTVRADRAKVVGGMVSLLPVSFVDTVPGAAFRA